MRQKFKNLVMVEFHTYVDSFNTISFHPSHLSLFQLPLKTYLFSSMKETVQLYILVMVLTLIMVEFHTYVAQHIHRIPSVFLNDRNRDGSVILKRGQLVKQSPPIELTVDGMEIDDRDPHSLKHS